MLVETGVRKSFKTGVPKFGDPLNLLRLPFVVRASMEST
jgi:hypothetical protein